MSPAFSIQRLQLDQVDQVLALLEANLKSNLEKDVASAEGFLTFQYDKDTILNMIKEMPQPVAISEDRIVGYALATSKTVCLSNPLLNSAIDVSDQLIFKGKPLREQPYYVMGQICIGEGFRGIGIFSQLYEEHKILFSNAFSCVVTEISDQNYRSLKAHIKQGFQVLHNYSDGETNWLIVAWDWQKPEKI